MPPSRFANVSKWRNAVAPPFKADQRFQELGLAQTSEFGSDIKVSPRFIVVKGSNVGSLLLLPPGAFGKYAKQAPSFQASSSPISDFDISPFDDDLMVVAAATGTVSIYQLPSLVSVADAFPPILSQPPACVGSFQAGEAVSNIAFHPTSLGIVATAHPTSIKLWNFKTTSTPLETLKSLSLPAPSVSLEWSPDGKLLVSTSKTGVIYLFDPRSASEPISSAQAHASKVKPTRAVFVQNRLFTTGFSAMREREWAVWDPLNLKNSLKRERIDTSNGVLIPLADQDRALVFLIGKGDLTVRWVEVDDSKVPAQGTFSAPFSVAAVALAPTVIHDVMTGEIDRLYLVSATADDSVVPMSIVIPRRQYIDFHPDLYPPTTSRTPAQSGAQWLAGSDAEVVRISQDPAKSAQEKSQLSSSGLGTSDAGSLAPNSNGTQATSSSSSSEPTSAGSRPHAAAHAAVPPLPDAAPAHKVTDEKPSFAAQPQQDRSASSHTQASSEPTAQPSAGGTTSSLSQTNLARKPIVSPAGLSTDSPRWSRRFISGNTPLIAAHQNLSGLDLSVSPDGRMLAANKDWILFPLAGPGGKIGFHSTQNTGRMPTIAPSLTCSSKLIDFALDPFDTSRVASIHEDCALRVWRLPQDKSQSTSIEEPEAVVYAKGAGKLSELAFHPTAQDLIATCSPEAGGKVVLWDTGRGRELDAISIEGDGATSLCWSPDGLALSLACKDKAVRVLTFQPSSATTSDSSSISDESHAANFLDKSLVFANHPDRPHVTLTFAQSSDNKIAGPNKKQLALSGAESMLMTHKLRSMHDGILVGIGTVLNDDPQLNARLLSSPPAISQLPRPIVLDSSLRTPVESKLITNYAAGLGRQPLLFCSAAADPEHERSLQQAGVEVIRLDAGNGKSLDWYPVLSHLHRIGIKRLMVEGGAAVIDGLMSQQDLIDTLLVTVAPTTVGDQGCGFTAALPEKSSDHVWPFRTSDKFGKDNVLVWQKKSNRSTGGTRSVQVTTSQFSDLRNIRTIWLSSDVLLIAGHSTGSVRQMRLLRKEDSGELIEVARQSLDVSPAVLFPYYDADTNVLWLWSKGERSIQPYEIHLGDKNVFTALPAFRHQEPQLGLAFLSKLDVDPKQVEIAVSYRLERGEIRRVSWTIPRLRKEFFQDDIYLPTKDLTRPLTTAREWISGGENSNGTPIFVDLRPDGMTLLSEAPEIKKESKLPKGPIAKELSEEEKKEQLLQGIFNKAKNRGGEGYDTAGVTPSTDQDEDSDDEGYQVGAAAKRAPDNDDWSD